jgi:hypothetical protein
MTDIGYDSTVPGDVPGNAAAIFPYKDGQYAWSAAAIARFPHARKGEITISGIVGVQIIDCEPNCVWPPSRAAQIAHETLSEGVRPTLYANASTWPSLDVALRAVGIGRTVNCDGWLADYDGDAVIPAGYVAKQFASHNTHPVYDTSITNGVWPNAAAPPKPPEPTPMPGLAHPAVTIFAAPNGQGYWIVSSDGGVFAYGVPFFGSLGSVKLSAPIVGASCTPTGKGYYLVGADGGVFCFGDAVFHGTPAAAKAGRLLESVARVKATLITPPAMPGHYPVTSGDGNRAIAA